MALSASKTPAAPKKPGAPKKPTTKSKTGNSACSEAASNWQLAIRGKEPLDPGTYKTLAKCRALTSTRKRADADVKGGKITETARTGIENRLQSRFDRGLITKKDRTARAKELVAARQKRAISTEERQRAATITEKVTGQKVVQRAEKPMKGQKRTETAAPDKPTLSQGKQLVQKVREKEQQRAEAKSGVRTLKTSEIQADPTRFQYKLNTANPAGVTNQFKETKVWNPELAGVVQVWRDPANNQTYVVNGHHRFELAQRLGVKNLNVQYIKAATDKEARQKGALTNIAEGRGTSTDAAKFMRDSPNVKDWHEEFRKSGISLSERTASEGLALKDLHPEIFRKVVDELTPVSRAAAIGRAGLHPEDQLALFRKAEAGGWTAGKTGEFATEMKNSARVKTGGGGLFGDDEETNLFEFRAGLADRFKSRLSSDKNLFGKVARTRNAGRIEAVGANKIDVEASAARAHNAENALMTFDSERKYTGRVNDELNKFGQRMAAGEKLDKVYPEFEKRMLQTLRLTNSGAFDRRKARLDAMTPEQRARANAIVEKVTRPALPATVAERVETQKTYEQAYADRLQRKKNADIAARGDYNSVEVSPEYRRQTAQRKKDVRLIDQVKKFADVYAMPLGLKRLVPKGSKFEFDRDYNLAVARPVGPNLDMSRGVHLTYVSGKGIKIENRGNYQAYDPVGGRVAYATNASDPLRDRKAKALDYLLTRAKRTQSDSAGKPLQEVVKDATGITAKAFGAVSRAENYKTVTAKNGQAVQVIRHTPNHNRQLKKKGSKARLSS